MDTKKADQKIYLKTLLKTYLLHEKEKIKDLDARGKWEYIWQYYKLWITGFVCAVAAIVYFTVHYFVTPQDNWFYGVFANTYADVGEHSELWEGFVS